MVVFSLEGVERAGGEHGGGLGRPARDDRVLVALDLEARAVDPQVVVGRQALDDLDRDAVGRVQGEGVLARDRVGARRPGLLEDVVQEPQTVFEIAEELLFLLLDRGLDPARRSRRARDRAGS